MQSTPVMLQAIPQQLQPQFAMQLEVEQLLVIDFPHPVQTIGSESPNDDGVTSSTNLENTIKFSDLATVRYNDSIRFRIR